MFETILMTAAMTFGGTGDWQHNHLAPDAVREQGRLSRESQTVQYVIPAERRFYRYYYLPGPPVVVVPGPPVAVGPPFVVPQPRPPVVGGPLKIRYTGTLEVRNGQLVLGVPLGGNLPAQTDYRLIVGDQKGVDVLKRRVGKEVTITGRAYTDRNTGISYLVVTEW